MKKKVTYASVATVTAKEQDNLLSKQNVVGVATAHKVKDEKDTGELCLSVFVTHKLPKNDVGSKNMIPANFGDIRTDVIQTGEIMAGNGAVDEKNISMKEELGIETLKQRIRPAMGGFSVGHYKISAGTIGTCVYDRDPLPNMPRRYYILSNNHVLANSNNAVIGDPILQPGPYDGGTVPNDIIAKLSRFVPIHFINLPNIPLNYVDAAIAAGEFHNLNREIYWIGYVKKVNYKPKVGDLVEKTGRTTNFTTGKILALNATVNVNYGGGNIARFINQIVTTSMSAPGDSGSLICDLNEAAVGLLFAGSSQITIANSISIVEKYLNIRIHP
jgi:S1-C subfamily serine protease